MVTVILTHEVKNLADWKTHFEAGESFRQQNGVKTVGIFHAVEDPNMVTVVTEFPSSEAFQAFIANPNLKADMDKAGVVSAPEAKVLNKI